jgi:hypothetical protein
MSLGERLLKYVETTITLSRSLEETKEHIRDIRSSVSHQQEWISQLEEREEATIRELDPRDQKIAAELSRQIQEGCHHQRDGKGGNYAKPVSGLHNHLAWAAFSLSRLGY